MKKFFKILNVFFFIKLILYTSILKSNEVKNSYDTKNKTVSQVDKSSVDRSPVDRSPEGRSPEDRSDNQFKKQKSIGALNLNTLQSYMMVGVWKEKSLLLRNEVTEYKIDTLNTVVRLGMVHTFYNARFTALYGFIIGQSENSSSENSFTYFQRSVSLVGGELSFGFNFLRSKVHSFGLSVGGIYRSIKHSLPDEEYRFKTATGFIPNLSLDLSWQLSQNWSLRQNVGTQGRVMDTLWSFGFGYLL